MALNKLAFMPDSVGNNSFLRNPPLYIVNLVLKAGNAVSFETPVSTAAVIFSANGEFWVNPNGATAIVPQESLDNGSELNPLGYQIGERVSLSIVAPSDISLSIAVYS